MKLREHLLSIKDQIACEMCGQCCPRIYPNKQGNLCSSHPSSTGQEDTRAHVCTLSPVDLATLGAACPPVTKKVLEITGIVIKEHVGGLGVINYDTDNLREVLNMKVG